MIGLYYVAHVVTKDIVTIQAVWIPFEIISFHFISAVVIPLMYLVQEREETKNMSGAGEIVEMKTMPISRRSWAQRPQMDSGNEDS